MLLSWQIVITHSNLLRLITFNLEIMLNFLDAGTSFELNVL